MCIVSYHKWGVGGGSIMIYLHVLSQHLPKRFRSPMQRHIEWTVTDVLKNHSGFIFRVKQPEMKHYDPSPIPMPEPGIWHLSRSSRKEKKTDCRYPVQDSNWSTFHMKARKGSALSLSSQRTRLTSKGLIKMLFFFSLFYSILFGAAYKPFCYALLKLSQKKTGGGGWWE